jgi:hypothetical protein
MSDYDYKRYNDELTRRASDIAVLDREIEAKKNGLSLSAPKARVEKMRKLYEQRDEVIHRLERLEISDNTKRWITGFSAIDLFDDPDAEKRVDDLRDEVRRNKEGTSIMNSLRWDLALAQSGLSSMGTLLFLYQQDYGKQSNPA